MKKFPFGLQFFLLILMLMLAQGPVLFAFEPPLISVKKAIENGNVAFSGRIIKIEELERQKTRIIGVAHIQINDCYYGMDCDNRKFAKMHFVIRTVVERSLPVQFNVSDEILIVLSKPVQSSTFFFNSDWNSGFDHAFIIGDRFPEGYHRNDKVRYINIYRHRLTYLEEKDDIDKLAKERALKLNER